MSDPNDAQVCDLCKGGHVAKRNQQVTFRQWTDKGYVFLAMEYVPGRTLRALLTELDRLAAETTATEATRRQSQER